MAVGSAGGNRQDEISRMKDYYSQREVEKDHKHSEEIQNLTRAHGEEMQKAQDQGKAEITQIREYDKNKMSDQEKKFQQDIAALKALYQKKLEDARKG
jgi:hypothetical protein